MKKLFILLYIPLFLCFLPYRTYALNSSEDTTSDNITVQANAECNMSHIFDSTNSLTKEEVNNLNEIASKTEKSKEITIMFVIENNLNGKDVATFTNDFFAENIQKFQYKTDGIVYLIDLNSKQLYISTFGRCADILSKEELSFILDKSYNYATNGEYYECLRKMVNESFSATNFFSISNLEISEKLIPTPKSILFGFILSMCIVFILLSLHNLANKKPSATTYLSSNIIIKDKREFYLGNTKEVIKDYYKTQEYNGPPHRGGML